MLTVINFSRSNPVAYAAIIFFVSTALYMFGGGAMLMLGEGRQLDPLIFSLTQVLFFMLPALILAQMSYLPTHEILRFKRPQSSRTWIDALLSWIGVTVFTLGFVNFLFGIIPESYADRYIEMLESIYEQYSMIFAMDTPLSVVRAIFIGAITPAIVEEIVFRGAVQRHLEEKLSTNRAVFWTSIMFSVIHLNPIHFASIFIIGYMAGKITAKSGSIFPAMALHTINNAVSIITMYRIQEADISYEEMMMSGSMPMIASFGIMLIGLAILVIVLAMLDRRDAKT